MSRDTETQTPEILANRNAYDLSEMAEFKVVEGAIPKGLNDVAIVVNTTVTIANGIITDRKTLNVCLGFKSTPATNNIVAVIVIVIKLLPNEKDRINRPKADRRGQGPILASNVALEEAIVLNKTPGGL